MKDDSRREKSWKLMYLRSEKLSRAAQFGLEYPIIRNSQKIASDIAENKKTNNILFVCSRNQWRSPTAEQIWRNHSGLSVRSAGTSPNAKRVISINDIRWADIIFVMEQKHKDRLQAIFNRSLQGKIVHVLDIPDEYKYMDAELIACLQDVVTPLLNNI